MIKQLHKDATMFLKGSLFLLGVLLFFFSSLAVFWKIEDLFEEGGIVGAMYTDASDSQIQIAILKNGFVTLIFIGLVIISLLMIHFFKDWYKDYKKEETNK